MTHEDVIKHIENCIERAERGLELSNSEFIEGYVEGLATAYKYCLHLVGKWRCE